MTFFLSYALHLSGFHSDRKIEGFCRRLGFIFLLEFNGEFARKYGAFLVSSYYEFLASVSVDICLYMKEPEEEFYFKKIMGNET